MPLALCSVQYIELPSSLGFHITFIFCSNELWANVLLRSENRYASKIFWSDKLLSPGGFRKPKSWITHSILFLQMEWYPLILYCVWCNIVYNINFHLALYSFAHFWDKITQSPHKMDVNLRCIWCHQVFESCKPRACVQGSKHWS